MSKQTMKAFVARDFGRIVGAYWAPANSGFGYAEAAEAAREAGAARLKRLGPPGN